MILPCSGPANGPTQTATVTDHPVEQRGGTNEPRYRITNKLRQSTLYYTVLVHLSIVLVRPLASMNTTKLQAIDRLLSEIRRGIHCTRQKGEPDRDYTAPNLPYPNTVADIQVPICLQASTVADHRCRRLEKFEGSVWSLTAFDIPGCGRSGPCVLVRQWTGARSADQAFGELSCSQLAKKKSPENWNYGCQGTV